MHRLGRNEGFTLIELAVVCIVIGILASIAIPNYASTKARSGRASCVSNQRNLYTAATLYVADQGVGTVTLTSADLLAAGAIPERLADCSDEQVDDDDDYEITIVNGVVTDIECLVFPAEHLWDP